MGDFFIEESTAGLEFEVLESFEGGNFLGMWLDRDEVGGEGEGSSGCLDSNLVKCQLRVFGCELVE